MLDHLGRHHLDSHPLGRLFIYSLDRHISQLINLPLLALLPQIAFIKQILSSALVRAYLIDLASVLGSTLFALKLII